MSPKVSDLIQNTAEVERMSDVLVMGLSDSKEVAVSLVSSGVTLENLFGNA